MAVVLTGSLAGSPAGHAQTATNYPDKPVHAIVPFAAGGNADVNARLLGRFLQEKLGQPFVIDNRGGAGGLIGGSAVAKATPDGYTVMFGTNSPIFASAVLGGAKAPYSSKDLEPVGRISTVPLVLAVNANSKLKTFADFAEAAKTKDAIRLGHAGNGTTNHVAGIQIANALSTSFLFVPYRGSSAAVADLLAENIDASTLEVSACIQLVDAGSLRAIAVIDDKRAKRLPNVPTLAELGLKGVDVMTFAGVMLPKGTPPDVVRKLSEAVFQVASDQAFQAKLEELGADPAPLNATDFATFLTSQVSRYEQLAKEGAIQLE
ncbi:tripartite tricarboxylate transporter substrate binding protein [Bradyrhizobium diazoefficiens]|nr:tripartite tricarboxylate transporter substrate binding protein [Bradyrhizobium diazoefficiens]MBR0846395.1 tripartite tricarboxylate transporter substrate binding protein [Bradyrhizobium diazoefficiens]